MAAHPLCDRFEPRERAHSHTALRAAMPRREREEERDHRDREEHAAAAEEGRQRTR